MAAGKRNTNRRQQYAVPFPLHFLQEELALQHQHQLLSRQPHDQRPQVHAPSTPSIPKKPSHIHDQHWSPIDPLLEAIRVLYEWSKGLSHSKRNRAQLTLIPAEFHPRGDAVWVVRSEDIKILFQQGFFGKGTLSRSEPTWKQRTTAENGGDQGLSLEEITRKRRIERAQLKKEKQSSPQTMAGSSIQAIPAGSKGSPKPIHATAATLSLTNNIPSQQSHLEDDEDYEHLQLSFEEAFFLVFAVECISVTPSGQSAVPMTIQECWLRFAQSSLEWTNTNESSLQTRRMSNSSGSFQWRADNPFIVRYVAYHYFRSQGWIVKDGLKYGTDFLLYRKGMVFGHSQYAVKVIPCASLDAVEQEMEQQGRSTSSKDRSAVLRGVAERCASDSTLTSPSGSTPLSNH
ncbi:tRNA-splicing endonuclease subunit Sen2 [Entomortierella parvispora]|uniref:tRNA-splicing endonuclease subunit Sen2 n=1 Tax=Entomortierella parvispora TaxID=205924 RepID=A0A9P3H5N2_9FUNG|nr:tRNA-splicing endonuclease subunit Sen2 [Entomortierella parvispora]